MADESPSSVSKAFNRQTPSELRQARTESRAAAAEISGRAHDVSKKAEEHYEKHRTDWVRKEYGKLIVKQGLSPELRPDGHEGRKLTSEADRNVAMRQGTRQARIALARRSMIRDLSRDDGRDR